MSYLTDQQISNRLHKQSFKEDFQIYKMGMTKNHSFSDYNKFPVSKYKNPEEELSQWKTQQQATVKKNTSKKQSFLPEMRQTRKIFQQMQKKVKIVDQMDRNNSDLDFKSYRYTFLKQFVNYTPKQKKAVNSFQLSKIDMKLRFPAKYSKLQNLQVIQNSFYIQKTSRGLIPSIKKLVSPPAASRYAKKAAQQNNDWTYKPKQYKQNDLTWIDKQIEQQHFLKKSIQNRQKRVKLGRIQKRLPTNFLIKFKKKNKSKQREEQITRLKECITFNKNQL